MGKIFLSLKELQLYRSSVGPEHPLCRDKVLFYLSSYHPTGFVQDMMKCYCTNKITPSQKALIAITRDAKICFALFILIMSMDWFNASFVSLLNWKPSFYLATENYQYPSKGKKEIAKLLFAITKHLC